MNIISPAKKENIDKYLEILTSARDFQRAQGFVQWPDGYPGRAELVEDLESACGYELLSDGEVTGYLYIGFDGDPAYPEIKGAWHYDEPYAVIHRVAIGEGFRGKGLADELFRLAAEFCAGRGVKNLRIDTDEKNERMRHILEKNGFSYCGTVVQGNGDRMAFDKKIEG